MRTNPDAIPFNRTPSYCFESFGRDLISNALHDLRRGQPLDRDDALAWFSERSDNPLGYGWALEVSGMNPNAIRQAICFFESPKWHTLAHKGLNGPKLIEAVEKHFGRKPRRKLGPRIPKKLIDSLEDIAERTVIDD